MLLMPPSRAAAQSRSGKIHLQVQYPGTVLECRDWNLSKLFGENVMDQGNTITCCPGRRAWPRCGQCARGRPGSGCWRNTLPQVGVAELLRLRNLGDQLLDQGVAKRLVILSNHDEGAGPANHVVTVVAFEIRRRWLAQDHQPVDGDARGHGVVARKPDIAAGIVDSVAGHVDGTVPFVGCALELTHGEVDPATDRGPARV